MQQRSPHAPSFRVTLRQLCIAHTVLLGLSIGAGWTVAAVRGASVEMATNRSDRTAGIMQDATIVFKANVRVVALLVLGGCTLGIFTLALFVWNGYLLGFGLSALDQTAPQNIPYVLTYAPIEFAALTVAAAASMHLALQVFRALVAHEALELRSTALAFAASILLLASAAAIESWAKVRLTHLP